MTNTIALAFYEDEIKDIGDKIASLTILEIVQLKRYLASLGVELRLL
jgi:hypothetical protein